MKTMGLAEASKKLEGIPLSQTRPLTPAEHASWRQAKRGRGRPRKPASQRAARILVTIAPDLLVAADAYARKEGISRAQLIARGLETVIGRS